MHSSFIRLLLVPLVLVSPSLQAPQAVLNSFKRRPLTFNKDGTFQVSVFEDLHFGESTFPLKMKFW